jgi:GTPase SAR1 family protein
MEVIRVAMIGPGGVGKTSMLRRMGGTPFDPRYFPTEGREYHVLEFPGIRFEITEYAGQEQFRGIPKEELDAITSYIVVTSPSKRDKWIGQKLMRRLPDNIPYSVVVNKSDLGVVDQTQTICSARQNENLLAPFRELVTQVLEINPTF